MDAAAEGSEPAAFSPPSVFYFYLLMYPPAPGAPTYISLIFVGHFTSFHLSSNAQRRRRNNSLAVRSLIDEHIRCSFPREATCDGGVPADCDGKESVENQTLPECRTVCDKSDDLVFNWGN